MIVGVPKETKSDEYRVSILPVGAQMLVDDGHRVLVERGSGAGSGYEDQQYAAAGATLVSEPATVFGEADLIVNATSIGMSHAEAEGLS